MIPYDKKCILVIKQTIQVCLIWCETQFESCYIKNSYVIFVQNECTMRLPQK